MPAEAITQSHVLRQAENVAASVGHSCTVSVKFCLQGRRSENGLRKNGGNVDCRFNLKKIVQHTVKLMFVYQLENIFRKVLR